MRRLSALGFLVALAVGIAAPAAPFTSHFFSVDAELRYRLDNDFTGNLDAAAKRRQSAVLKSLALLDRPAEDMADDLKTAAGVARLLEKAYPEEFPAPAPPLVVAFEPQTLDMALDGALDGLTDDVFDGNLALAARIPSLTPKAGAAVQKVVDTFLATLKRSYPTRTARAKGLQKVWKLVLRGNRIADRGPLP